MAFAAPMRPGVRDAAQLLCVVALAIALPAIVGRAVRPEAEEVIPEGPDFDPPVERTRLVAVRPDWILIGNSMLNSRVDWRYLSEISGRRARKVSQGGTQSAIWFLFLKNVVVRSGVKPEWVTIFFRDTDLSWPEFRTEGVNEDLIRRLRDPIEPEYDAVLEAEDSKGGPLGLTRSLLKTVFPSAELTSAARRKLQNFAFGITDGGADIKRGIRRVELNELFSLGRLRHDLGGDVTTAGPGQTEDVAPNVLPDPGMYDGAPMTFDPSPSASFLPHMIALAKEHGFKLHFHRIKRRPLPDNSRPDSRLLQAYMAEWQAWLEPQGCVLTDESQDASLTLDMYVDGDHIAFERQRRYIENFWRRVEPIIGKGPRAPSR